ncbi:uncharacterized protein LOC144559293 [Carex rostrata]
MEEVDPETSYRIEVKIQGFFNKKNDGTKTYVKGRTLKWVVDSDRFSLCDAISGISDEISWGSCQTLRILVFDKNEGKEVGVLSESQILEMFRMYQKERLILLNVVVCDTDGSSNCSGAGPTYPCTPSQPNTTIAPGSQSQVESSQGCNTSSQLAPSIAPDSQVGTSQNSHVAGQPDPFDDPDHDEYMGVNDEDIYHDGDDEAMLLPKHEEHTGLDHILKDEDASIDDAVDSE